VGCDRPQRHSIDEALANGAPYWSVAKRCDYLTARFMLVEP